MRLIDRTMVSPILRYLFALLEPVTARALFRFLVSASLAGRSVDLVACPPDSSPVETGLCSDAWSSQVDNDVADRTRTADEQIAGRWEVERLGLVHDLS